MKTIYGAYHNSDMTEGRGPDVLDLAFETKSAADAYIDTKPGVMGRMQKWSEQDGYGDWNVKPIIVCASLEEAEQVSVNKKREKALSKLTTEDRRVLGLS